jgi:integrase
MRHEFKVMDEENVNHFLEAAKKTEYYALFFCALFCGMRRSELLDLEWQDVDLNLMQASVNRTLHHLNNGKTVISNPKTAKSKRMIALSPSTCIVLRDVKQKQLNLRIALELPKLTDNDMVFSHWDGSPFLPDSVTHAWMMLARRNNLKGLRLHDARHTMASLILKNGIHAKIVQESLGHASIKTTLDIYSHVAPGLQAAAANRLDDVLIKHENKLDRELKELVLSK